jgi:quercetin dioxygenase-like cupin family protein
MSEETRVSEDHFSLEGAGTPTAEGVFVDPATVPAVEFLPGLKFQPTLGQNSLANYVTFEPHSEAPLHAHIEEQVVVVVKGQFDFTIDGQTRTMRAGDVAVIPPWVPHGAVAGAEGCTEVDIFSPPRTTLIEHARAAGAVAGTEVAVTEIAAAEIAATGTVGETL